MRRATFTIAVAFLCSTAAAAPLVTYESPCECRDNHGKQHWAEKNDPALPPAETSAIQAVTPSDIFSWQGPTEYLVPSSVGYVQLPHAVGYIVLSSRDHASYQKDSGALEKVLKTLVHLEMQFENKPQ
jgi:hypothetical protein